MQPNNGNIVELKSANGSLQFHNILAGSEVIGTYDRTYRRYFLKDHLGSIRTTVDQSGNVDGYNDYYPFGLVMPGRSSNSANPTDNYKFTGHERDTEASLTLDYMMARNYDPVIGRFLQIDPLTDAFPGWTPYHYVHNNPLNLVDPTGMSAEEAESCPELCRRVLGQAFSWLENPWNKKGQEIERKTQEVKAKTKEVASDVAETAVKEGPEVLDEVSAGAVKATAFVGTGAVVAASSPVPLDDIGFATGVTITSSVAVASDITATTLSFFDKTYFGGDPEEFNLRLTITALGLSSTQGFAAVYGSGLKKTLLDAYKQEALKKAAATTSTSIMLAPLNQQKNN